MSQQEIPLKEVFGKTITDILCKFGTYDEWLETADCTIELDNEIYMGFPSRESSTVWEREKPIDATSLLTNLSDIVVYHVNKEGKSIKEIADTYRKRKNKFGNIIREIFLFGEEVPREYEPYKTEYQENRLKYIHNAKIKDYLWRENDGDTGFFELDNGYIISETIMNPRGTGLAGLNSWQNMQQLQNRFSETFLRLSEVE